MLIYEFETIRAEAEGDSLFGGVGLTAEGHRELILRRAEEGWRYAGCIPCSQRADGFIESWDLIFEREE